MDFGPLTSGQYLGLNWVDTSFPVLYSIHTTLSATVRWTTIHLAPGLYDQILMAPGAHTSA